MRSPRAALRTFGVALALVVAVATGPAQASSPVDQSQTIVGDGGMGIWSSPWSLWVAQTFTAGVTGDLTQVDLLLFRINNPGDLTVQIESVNGGVPSGIVLTSTTVPQSSVWESFTWVQVTLGPIPVTAGTQYAIVLSAANASLDPYNPYGWVFVPQGDPYAPGALMISTDTGGNWRGGGDGGDTGFKTYVSPPTLPVGVDIKAGDTLNSISLTSHGLLPVAILGSAHLDVSHVDPNTISLGGLSLTMRGSSKAPKLAYSIDDVNADGYQDLVAFFDVQTLVTIGALTSSTMALTLTGALADGAAFQGTDTVNVVR